MQLLSMEVNHVQTGDQHQVENLAAGLNAVCAPRGSGKTSLVGWLRGLIESREAESTPPKSINVSGFEKSIGRCSLRDGDIDFQLERTQRAGRVAGKIVRRATNAWNGSAAANYGHFSSLPLTQAQREAFSLLTAIPSDAHACDRLWDAARLLNIDSVTKSPYADERLRCTDRERELETELRSLDGLRATREGLIARRRQVESELDRVRREADRRRSTPETDEHRRMADRLAAIQRDAQSIRDEIAELEAAGHSSQNVGAAPVFFGQPAARASRDQSYRQRLIALDAQLARWRSTLTELRAHREEREASATDAQLDSQLGEQFSAVNQATPRLALRSLEAQIVAARRHFDVLLEGVDRYRADQDAARSELPQTLRVMQRELQEVCQQLSRHESLTEHRATREQILQLTRCEAEMRLAIERLIIERGELLRTLATACHLTVDQVAVAYSDQCRCADHPQLDAWLTALSPARTSSDIEPPASLFGHVGAKQTGYVDTHRLQSRRAAAQARLQECEHDQRETEYRIERLGFAPIAPDADERGEADLLAESDNISEDLLRLETRDRLRVELSETRRRLQQLPPDVDAASTLRGCYLRHLAALDPATIAGTSRPSISFPADSYRSANGQVISQPTVATRIHESALRLAIIELLRTRGISLPLILDQTLDQLNGPQRLTAVRYLSEICERTKLQVIVLTEDSALVEAIAAVRGNIVPLVVSRFVVPSESPTSESDLNRVLLAYANDFEADKWSQADLPPKREVRTEPIRRPMLNRASQIDDVPSISSRAAGRLRLLGIATVGDLMDCDAQWLADSTGPNGVPVDAVLAWQSEARLLCALPQLRPFDARVLAGAGIRDPRQLTAMHPSRLLEKVELFLSTDRGRHILRTGTSYELSRITTWIASAKRNGSTATASSRFEEGPAFGVDPTAPRGDSTNGHAHNGHSPGRTDAKHVSDSASRRTESSDSANQSNGSPSRLRRPSSQRRDEPEHGVPTYHIAERHDGGEAPSRRTDRSTPSASEVQPDRRRPRRDRAQRRGREDASVDASADQSAAADASAARQRFYLELNSPLVDAPSIGQSMADQLEKVGLSTVRDLLAAKADRIANELDIPRVTGDVLRTWQAQANLVCRIPNLRGHDAQILVAVDITSPESLAGMKPKELLSEAQAFAESSRGQRVLRGSQAPDLEEVTHWIRWAGESRKLQAA